MQTLKKGLKKCRWISAKLSTSSNGKYFECRNAWSFWCVLYFEINRFNESSACNMGQIPKCRLQFHFATKRECAFQLRNKKRRHESISNVKYDTLLFESWSFFQCTHPTEWKKNRSTFIVAQTRAFKNLCRFDWQTMQSTEIWLCVWFLFFLNSKTYKSQRSEEKKKNQIEIVIAYVRHETMELNLSKGIMAGKSENKQMNRNKTHNAHRACEIFSHGTESEWTLIMMRWALPLWPC